MPTRLAELLLQTPPDVQPGDVPQLVESGLAAEVAARLPPDHPRQAALRPARLGLAIRNQQLRRTLRPLLAAWQAAGVDSVLLKGFALDQVEYPVPGRRPYGDVDVLIHQADLIAALQAARALGWVNDGFSASPQQWTHEMAHLISPDGTLRLDIHRHLVSRHRQRKNARLTAACWQDSRTVSLDGTAARVLAPRDMALHLSLTRVWGDRGLKAADYPDLQVLMANHGLTPQAVAQRAAQLGVAHTWAAFLGACNPWQTVFCLGETELRTRFQHAARQDGQRPLWTVVFRQPHLLTRFVRRLALALPDVLAVRGVLFGPHRPQDLPARWPLHSPARTLTGAQLYDVIRGVDWLSRWLYPHRKGHCVPKALATYRALVRRGYPAVFVSGVRRTAAGQIEGHAWVEGPHGPLAEYEGGQQRQVYQVLFEVPVTAP